MQCFFLLCQGPSPMAVRYIYAGLFLFAIVFACVARDNRISYFQGQRSSGCLGDRECLAAEGVLITSLTFFLVSVVMFFSTMRTSRIQDRRSAWHCGWWPVKIALLAASFVLSELAPSYLIQLYGEAARFGAVAFLVIQLINTIRYITRLNYKWCLTNFEQRYLRVAAVSVVANLLSTAVIVYMGLRYTACWLNVTFIATTLVLVYLMDLISLLSQPYGGLFMEPGLIGVYIVLLCLMAITSEPAESSCHKKQKAGDWLTVIFFLVGLISTAASAFTTGSSYKCVQPRNVAEDNVHVPYGYGFFHFVFATGCMYFGMLFVGWDTHHTAMDKWNADVGWTSVWVHIGNEALAVASFMAILLARIFGIDWLRHLLAWIFGTGDQLAGGESQTTTSDETDTGRSPSSQRSMEFQPSDTPTNAGGIPRRNDGAEPPPPPPPSSQSSSQTTEQLGVPPYDMDTVVPPPPSSHQTSAEIQMSAMLSTSTNVVVGTSSRNQNDDDDDFIREWESD